MRNLSFFFFVFSLFFSSADEIVPLAHGQEIYDNAPPHLRHLWVEEGAWHCLAEETQILTEVGFCSLEQIRADPFLPIVGVNVADGSLRNELRVRLVENEPAEQTLVQFGEGELRVTEEHEMVVREEEREERWCGARKSKRAVDR